MCAIATRPSRGRSLLRIGLALAAVGCGRIDYDEIGIHALDASMDARATIDAPSDSGSVIDAPADAFADARPTTDSCVPVEETCNGLDDDCDGVLDQTFERSATWEACPTAPRAGPFTLGGVTWDQADVVREAFVAKGMLELGRAIRYGNVAIDGADPARSLGHLLAPVDPPTLRWVPMPEVGFDTTIEPNLTRVAIEVSWSASWAVRDGPGDDLVVYEQGDPIGEPEAFAVSLRDARTGVWTRVRFHHFADYSSTALLFTTRIDLASEGLANGVVDRVRLHNVFNSDAPAGADRVDDPSGEGFVIRPGDPGWDGAHPMLTTARGIPFPTSLLDADLLWVAALHPTVAPRCCVAP